MAKQKRRQLERRWRQSRLTVHLDIFKEQKRHVNKLISSAKSSYYMAKIIEAASDQKQLYNVVNTMLVKPEAASDQKQLYNVVNTMLVKLHLIRSNYTTWSIPCW